MAQQEEEEGAANAPNSPISAAVESTQETEEPNKEPTSQGTSVAEEAQEANGAVATKENEEAKKTVTSWLTVRYRVSTGEIAVLFGQINRTHVSASSCSDVGFVDFVRKRYNEVYGKDMDDSDKMTMFFVKSCYMEYYMGYTVDHLSVERSRRLETERANASVRKKTPKKKASPKEPGQSSAENATSAPEDAPSAPEDAPSAPEDTPSAPEEDAPLATENEASVLEEISPSKRPAPTKVFSRKKKKTIEKPKSRTQKKEKEKPKKAASTRDYGKSKETIKSWFAVRTRASTVKVGALFSQIHGGYAHADTCSDKGFVEFIRKRYKDVYEQELDSNKMIMFFVKSCYVEYYLGYTVDHVAVEKSRRVHIDRLKDYVLQSSKKKKNKTPSKESKDNAVEGSPESPPREDTPSAPDDEEDKSAPDVAPEVPEDIQSAPEEVPSAPQQTPASPEEAPSTKRPASPFPSDMVVPKRPRSTVGQGHPARQDAIEEM